MATIGPSISLTSIGPSGSPDIAYSNCYAVFQSPWGVPNKWQICQSYTDFLKMYGGLDRLTTVASGQTADTYTSETNATVVQALHAIKGYFDEKGAQSPGVLFACRSIATSSGPTAALRTFADFAASNNTTVTSKWHGLHGGTTQVSIINPSPRLGLLTLQTGTVAVSAGATAVTGTGTAFETGSTWVGWGIKIGANYYTIESVTNSTALVLDENASVTETAAVFSVGANTTAAYVKVEHPRSNTVEEWDLYPNTQSAADISRLSQLVSITLPAGLQLPKTTAPGNSGWVKLHSGTPGTADTYGATDADMIGTTTTAGVKTGLQVFNNQDLGTGLVIIPGKTSATIDTGIKSHCETYYRFGLYSPSSGLTLTSAQTEFANVSSNFGAGWAPRIWVQNQNTSAGGNVLVDNVGHLAGLCARMDKIYGGPHKSPAGIDHSFFSVIDVESQADGSELFDDSGSNTLADVNVNTLRRKKGIVSWGLRSFASDPRYRQMQVGRTVCLVYLSCFQLMARRTFEPIDSFGGLFSAIKGDLDSFFFSIKKSLYGTDPGDEPKRTDAWFVVCDKTNNPNIQIGSGKVHADVSFVPVLNAEAIHLNIAVAAPGFGASSAGVI